MNGVPDSWRLDPAPTGTCPVCDGRRWMYYNGGRTTCDGCGGDGRNHYPASDPADGADENGGRVSLDA